MTLWPIQVFCVLLHTWRLWCRAHEKALYFCPSNKKDQASAFPTVTEYYHVFMWRKQIYISSSEKYNDFTFPQFLLIRFLSEHRRTLIYFQSVFTKSCKRVTQEFWLPRIMIPGPGCFSLLHQHTAAVKLPSLPCSWGFLLHESTAWHNCSG